LHQEVACGVEHLALAEGELLVTLQHEQVTEHLGDLEHAARLDLFGVLPVAPVPRLLVDLDLLVTQDAVDLGNHVLADDAAESDGVDVLGRDHDRHVAVEDAQHVKLALRTRNHPRLDALDHADAMRRVHDLFPYLEHTGHSSWPPESVRMSLRILADDPLSGQRTTRCAGPGVARDFVPSPLAHRPATS